ncbi:hypothetical protein PUV54_02650 [Hyphococcus flavus]|uniref:DUF4174 domain-containing protein n=1 Tax=Hyphococcus flavus TaxID=1866326 RepID=A0AAE9ZCB1_9PROT|nr:hypothetical protein [Hyphococcus flavus]WDI32089.1 hypothetical protein PUV54_02650 [Hyphococcus flavus]
MELTFAIIATCLVFGVIAAVASVRPNLLPEIGASLRKTQTVKKFSPRNTLFIIGTYSNHPACKMQRRLLKPAIAALIRNDVTVMEVYGDDQPRQNGEAIDWLDPALLRHALDAEDGFYVIYVDADGKTLFRSEAPMVTSDILDRAKLDIATPVRGAKRKNPVLKKLRAA